MMMFLMIVASSFAALAILSVMFSSVAPRSEAEGLEARPETRPELAPRFFAGDIVPVGDRSQVPVEVLLSQLERHVRSEQAVAESFLALPTPETLAAKPTSPFVN